MDQKKIAIVSQTVNEGGVGTVVRLIHDFLAASEQYEPTIISVATSSRDDVSTRLTRPDQWHLGVRSKQIRWQTKQVEHIGAHWVELEFMRYRRRALLTETLRSFDLVQVVSGSPAIAYAMAELKQPICINAATLLEIERRALLTDAPLPRRLWSKMMTRASHSYEVAALNRADHVFAVSQYTHQLMTPYIDQSRLSLVPSGVDTQVFHPPEAYAADGHLIAVGRWADPRKNVRLLFHAYQKVCQQIDAPRLLLVGMTRPTEADWRYAETLGIADRVDVHVDVSRDELVRLYQAASLFLMSSDEEGQGLVILEAMACGVPAISTRSGGPEMLIDEGVNGYLTPLGDAEVFASQTVVLLQDVERRCLMSAQARTGTVQTYSTQVMADSYLRVYDSLLSEK